MKTALFTVAYRQAEPFFAEFFASVAAQDERDFDLLILNDGANPQLLSWAQNVKVLDASGSAAALRRQGIEWMRAEGYEAAIFADIDDSFDPNRVSLGRELLRSCDIVVNELLLFGDGMAEPRRMLGARLGEGQGIGESDLRDCNCMGFSNTAARISSIANVANEVPDFVLAFDWNLYARAVIGGARAMFTGATQTGYRQHGANVAGVFDCSEAQIVRGVGVKADHYALLAGYGAWYRTRAEEYWQLRDTLRTNPEAKHDYCLRVRASMPSQPLWWESIRLEKELL